MSLRALDPRPARIVLSALLLGASAVSASCAYGPDETETVVQELNANTRAAYDYFIARGLTPVQSAGIVGNLIQESNVNPMAVQSGGPGRGIAQWSVGGRWDHDSGDNVVAYASSHGASVWGLNLQLQFIWYELTNFSWYGLSTLRGATTIAAATRAFESRYEGCGTCIETQRIAYAQQVYDAYSAVTWGARFVSQSFPYASAGAVSIHAGGTATVSITMRNTGTHAWDSHTCLATTMPRDRNSVFAGPEWRGADRPSCVPSGTTVASGANHTFTWVMHAPSTTGRHDEHWGMVEDGVTWFSASGQGGPADDQLEGIFEVTAPLAPADAGVRDAGGVTDDAAVEADASGSDDVSSETDASSDDGSTGTSDAARGDVVSDGGDGGDGGTDALRGGCSTTGGRGRNGSGVTIVAAALVAMVIGRRRRSSSR